MKITVEAKLGKVGGKDFLDTEVIVGDTRGNITRFIYETVDKIVLENMPRDTLEELHLQMTNEIQKRIIDGNW